MTTTATKGTIRIRNHPIARGVFWIQNAGGKGTNEVFTFLNSHHKFFDNEQWMGQTYNALNSIRINKFYEYATRNGFTIEWAH